MFKCIFYSFFIIFAIASTFKATPKKRVSFYFQKPEEQAEMEQQQKQRRLEEKSAKIQEKRILRYDEERSFPLLIALTIKRLEQHNGVQNIFDEIIEQETDQTIDNIISELKEHVEYDQSILIPNINILINKLERYLLS
jgi:hypothetical protein